VRASRAPARALPAALGSALAQRRLAALPKLQAVEQAVSREGLKLVLLTRLSPAFPFSLLNLAYGLSEVSLRDYTIGLIGILPGTILFCGLGALAGDVARFGEVLSGEADAGTWALRITGLLATVAVVWLVGRAARRFLLLYRCDDAILKLLWPQSSGAAEADGEGKEPAAEKEGADVTAVTGK
jgi:hypothetical protein